MGEASTFDAVVSVNLSSYQLCTLKLRVNFPGARLASIPTNDEAPLPGSLDPSSGYTVVAVPGGGFWSVTVAGNSNNHMTGSGSIATLHFTGVLGDNPAPSASDFTVTFPYVNDDCRGTLYKCGDLVNVSGCLSGAVTSVTANYP
jgi:hypothetical protein